MRGVQRVAEAGRVSRRGAYRAASGVQGIRRALAATGPWPRGRALRACGALAAAAVVAGWVITVGPRGPGLPSLPALLGLAVLAFALVRARPRLLGFVLAMLGVATAIPVLALRPEAAVVAGLGAALVAVLELGRWSIERRVDPPGEGLTEVGRWLHLGVVLAVGWLVGVGVVAAAAGRLDLRAWHAVLAVAAALALAAAVAATGWGRLNPRAGTGASSTGRTRRPGPR